MKKSTWNVQSSRVLVWLGFIALHALGASTACEQFTSQVCPGGNLICPQGSACVANNTQCAPETCGALPGAIKGTQGVEQCDDGDNEDGDGCSASCRVEECGDNRREPGEPCEMDGNGPCVKEPWDHSVTESWDTSVPREGARCRVPTCGDGILDTELSVHQDAEYQGVELKEECDGAQRLSEEDRRWECSPPTAPGDTACKLLKCGNGRVDRYTDGTSSYEEECDPKDPADDSPACTSECTLSRCGDGIVGPFENAKNAIEVCDPGADPLCSGDCGGPLLCGNGIIDSEFGEECDDGERRATTGCGPKCKTPRCGNEQLDLVTLSDGTVVMEMCDDGPSHSGIDGDGCSANCLSDEACGNGRIDTAVGEKCDINDKVTGANCSNDCRRSTECGNGKEDPGEDCDKGADGVAANSPLCDNDCSEPGCRDGVWNELAGEACDPTDKTGPQPCNNDCTESRCGDGIFNPADDREKCEPNLDANGMPMDSPGCSHDCQLRGCGDGVTYTPDEEECDGEENCWPPNTLNSRGENVGCSLKTCGDFKVSKPEEECDEGPSTTAKCLGNTVEPPDRRCHESTCGDGIINSSVVSGVAVEQCDPGNDRNGNSTCNGDDAEEVLKCKYSTCGDGHINTGAGEECEPTLDWLRWKSDSIVVTEQSVCNSETCRVAFCGDGTIDPGEECDPLAPVDDDTVCLPAGTRADDEQRTDLSCRKSICGDYYIDGLTKEDCDDGLEGSTGCNPAGAVGEVQGRSARLECKFSVCGDLFINESNEVCDDGGETANCNADCSLSRCLDGVVNHADGEECDLGRETSACVKCKLTTCNNGARESGEECDWSSTSEAERACSGSACKFRKASKPPNGYEPCVNGCECDRLCTWGWCGDGLVDRHEECDIAISDGCTDQCKKIDCDNGRLDQVVNPEIFGYLNRPVPISECAPGELPDAGIDCIPCAN